MSLIDTCCFSFEYIDFLKLNKIDILCVYIIEEPSPKDPKIIHFNNNMSHLEKKQQNQENKIPIGNVSNTLFILM